jgi:hypothetical protein
VWDVCAVCVGCGMCVRCVWGVGCVCGVCGVCVWGVWGVSGCACDGGGWIVHKRLLVSHSAYYFKIRMLSVCGCGWVCGYVSACV